MILRRAPLLCCLVGRSQLRRSSEELEGVFGGYVAIVDGMWPIKRFPYHGYTTAGVLFRDCSRCFPGQVRVGRDLITGC